MSENKLSFPDSIVLGIQEHHERIKTFLDLVCQSKEPVIIFRLRIACIYFARGIIELMLEAADKKQLSFSRDQLKKNLLKKLRWYNLIEKIRIHDFHRFGLIPPNPNIKTTFIGGPIKLCAKKGLAMYTSLKKKTTGNSFIKESRPLINNNGNFYDDDTGKYVTIKQILKDFLCDIPAVIDNFKKDLKS